MRNTVRRILACALVLAMTITMIPAGDVHATEVTEAAKDTIQSLQIAQEIVGMGQNQDVTVDVGRDASEITEAVLHVHRISDDSNYDIEAASVDTEGIHFTAAYDDVTDKGIYIVDSITYEADGNTIELGIADSGMEARYEVEDISADAIEEQMEYLSDGISVMSQSYNSNGAVIVLDPGHGGEDSGAWRTINGVNYYERDINLKIAQACKAKLEEYTGATVYLTREDNTSTCMSILDRVQFAQVRNANVIVSIHINSTPDATTTANGSQALCQNGNYISAVGSSSISLGNSILTQLAALGLRNRGTSTRDAKQDKYPDGSAADYYGINRYGKLISTPSIIIEHAFVNNVSDVANFLSSDSKLQAMGAADAVGIANYLGLTVKHEAPVLPAQPANGVNIYRLYLQENNGEHLYTTDGNEAITLVTEHGWTYEGVGWVAPTAGTPVYRLYNPVLKNHLYTTDVHEVEVLTTTDQWVKDNNGNPIFYSGGSKPIYRLYNEGLAGMHLLTTDLNEYNVLPQHGWQQENVALYAVN